MIPIQLIWTIQHVIQFHFAHLENKSGKGAHGAKLSEDKNNNMSEAEGQYDSHCRFHAIQSMNNSPDRLKELDYTQIHITLKKSLHPHQRHFFDIGKPILNNM